MTRSSLIGSSVPQEERPRRAELQEGEEPSPTWPKSRNLPVSWDGFQQLGGNIGFFSRRCNLPRE